jgi:hypothetical protein
MAACSDEMNVPTRIAARKNLRVARCNGEKLLRHHALRMVARSHSNNRMDVWYLTMTKVAATHFIVCHRLWLPWAEQSRFDFNNDPLITRQRGRAIVGDGQNDVQRASLAELRRDGERCVHLAGILNL